MSDGKREDGEGLFPKEGAPNSQEGAQDSGNTSYEAGLQHSFFHRAMVAEEETDALEIDGKADEPDLDESADEEPEPQASYFERFSFLNRMTLPELPWAKLAWVIVAVGAGFAASFLSSPQSLVASFRWQPEKVVGNEEGAAPEQAGKVVKVSEQAGTVIRVADRASGKIEERPAGKVQDTAAGKVEDSPADKAEDETVVKVGGSEAGRVQMAQVRDLLAQQQDTLGVETVDPVPRRPRRVRDEPRVGSVVTVPLSQGRLLRFDEPVESIFIADPAIADVRVVSPDVVYVYGKRLGITDLMAVSSAASQREGTPSDQRLTASVLLRVVTDPRPAVESLEELNPSAADANITLFGRRAIATGRTANVDQAVDVASVAQTYSPPDQPPINRTTVAGSTQINIRVRFAEISRNDLQSLGIEWDLAGSNSGFQFGFTKAVADPQFNPNLSARIGNSDFSLGVLIEALKQNGMLHILAEPNLTAVTGETASFLAGGEVPIPVPQGGNGDAVTVQYKPFGVSLLFTPTLVKSNRIGLKVKPEVSTIASTNTFSTAGFALPSFTVRRAETTVEVASGQTFAIAGLFQRQLSRNVEKIPVLGEVPILGELFNSERYQRNETELVILITPYLVEPVSDQKVATPLDREEGAPWQASIIDPTAKGAALAQPDPASGFIFK